MKPKKFSRKLGLNKKTIANLNNNEMLSANGGAVRTIIQTACGICYTRSGSCSQGEETCECETYGLKLTCNETCYMWCTQ